MVSLFSRLAMAGREDGGKKSSRPPRGQALLQARTGMVAIPDAVPRGRLAFRRALWQTKKRGEACRHRCGARSSKPVAGLTVCGRFDSYTSPPSREHPVRKPRACGLFCARSPAPACRGRENGKKPLSRSRRRAGIPSAHCLLSACRASSYHVQAPIVFPVTAPAAGGLSFAVLLRPVSCHAVARAAWGAVGGGRPGSHEGFPPSVRA